ncbi:MAG: sulfatase-like hydrolase/transferase [Desulfobacteraceae bacterium]|nr:sulfatase-like hydrolase/transferase [Desulfobacteraceae bacterium]
MRTVNTNKPDGSSVIFFCLFSLMLTAAELLIVNRKSGFLTGGFLASPIVGIFDIILLAVTVFLANMAVASIFFQPVLWIGRRWNRPMHHTLSLALFLAFLPVVVTDVLWYQLSRYFGNTVNFLLLRAISNDSLLMMFTNSYSYMLWPVLGIFLFFLTVSVFVRFWLRWVPFVSLSKKRRISGLSISCVFILGAFLLVAYASLKKDVLNITLGRFPASWSIRQTLKNVTDWDRDGTGVFGIPRDPASMNAEIYPYAPDIPGNGVDENGIMGDLPAGFLPEPDDAVESPVFNRRPHFVIFVLESFRADNLFRKIEGKEVSPNINKIAAEGVSAQWAFCHNGYTTGGLKSLFLGDPLNPAAPGSLIDDFKANGYQTACFSGENESFGNIAGATGMDRVDRFYDARSDLNRRCYAFSSPASLTVPGLVVYERLGDFLDERKGDKRPLFLYINLQDAHFPYLHHGIEPILTESLIPRSEIGPRTRDRVVTTYLNAIANVDAVTGKIINRLKESLDGDMALLLVADHGESLFDGGFLGHGHHLNNIQMHIPLIVKGFPAVIEEPVGQTEIRKMIHKALRVPPLVDQPPKRMVIEEKRIFQYLGSITRPVQIGWVGKEERWTVDLRNFKKRKNGGPWMKLGMTGDLIFSDLVHYWEFLQQHSFEVN